MLKFIFYCYIFSYNYCDLKSKWLQIWDCLGLVIMKARKELRDDITLDGTWWSPAGKKETFRGIPWLKNKKRLEVDKKNGKEIWKRLTKCMCTSSDLTGVNTCVDMHGYKYCELCWIRKLPIRKSLGETWDHEIVITKAPAERGMKTSSFLDILKELLWKTMLHTQSLSRVSKRKLNLFQILPCRQPGSS